MTIQERPAESSGETMKTKEWLNPNHMKIETGCKTFDRQCTCISTGNQIGNCVYSNYIRPSTETVCNNTTFDKGHLQNYDLQWMNKDAPQHLVDYIKKMDVSCILFQFHHRNNGHMIIDGWILTDDKHNLVKMVIGNGRKSRQILLTVKDYVCN